MVEHMVGMGSKREGEPHCQQPQHRDQAGGQDARRGREGYKV